MAADETLMQAADAARAIAERLRLKGEETPMADPNNSVLIGTRSFYEQFAQLAGTETPWPAWGDLTAEQARSWMLAYAATVEVAARTADAMLSLGMDVS